MSIVGTTPKCMFPKHDSIKLDFKEEALELLRLK